MDKQSFAEELRSARGDALQKQMADDLDVPFKTYQSWEEGRRQPGQLAQKQIRIMFAREHTSKKIPLKVEFMRFTVGYMEQRPEMKPIWDQSHKNILRWVASEKIISVFHLEGHGETLEAAAEMAGCDGVKWDKKQVAAEIQNRK